MFISRLFTPKWKHKNPQVRKQALLSLDTKQEESQAILTEVANKDAEIYLRRFAISKLNDIDCVQAMRNSDIEYLLIEDLTKRLCELLTGQCGPNGDAANDGYLCNKLEEIGEARVVDYVARHGASVSLRTFALAKIENESILADIAATDNDEQVRVEALARVTSSAALERIVKTVRRKDKAIYSAAQQKLKALQDQQQALVIQKKARQRIGADIVALVNLCEHSQQWLKNESRLLDLFQSWDKSATHLDNGLTDTDSALVASVAQAKEQFQQGLAEQKEREAMIARKEQVFTPVFEQMQRICDSLLSKTKILQQDVDPDEERLVEANRFIDSTKTQWQQLQRQYHDSVTAGASATDRFKAYNDQYETLIEALSLCIKEANTLGKYVAELNKLTITAGEWLKKAKPISDQELDTLQQQYRAVKAPDTMTPPGGLQQRFEELLSELSAVQQQQVSRQKRRVDDIKTLTTQLEEAITKGKTKYAMKLLNRGKKLFRELSDRDTRILQKQGVTGSFHSAELKIKELSDWRQWSSSPVKERMCESVEQLAEEILANGDMINYDYSAAVQQIKLAREEWRRICSGEGDSDARIWERFDQACNRAYEPCQQHFDKQAVERQLNYEKREKFCDDLASYYQKISTQPEAVDWKALSKILQVARQEWRQLGAVNRNDKDKINQRFGRIVEQIDGVSREHKVQNYDEKQVLIKRAKTALTSLDDGQALLSEAIELIKDLQRKWKQIGAAKQDKQLWDEFRAACDAIFSRRQAEMEGIKEAREAENAKREMVCEEIERITQLTGEEFRQTRQAVQTLKSDWDGMAELKKQHALERRFRRACDAYHTQEKRVRNEILAQVKRAINQNVKTCYQMERGLFTFLAGQSDLASLTTLAEKSQQEWCSDHHKSVVVDKAVNARFSHVASWVEKLQREDKALVLSEIKSLEAGIVQEKELLCLEVEILANTESPPDKKQARMEYQVSQLASKMQQVELLSPEEELERLLVRWHQAGVLATPLNDVFESRFFSALQAIDKEYQCAI